MATVRYKLSTPCEISGRVPFGFRLESSLQPFRHRDLFGEARVEASIARSEEGTVHLLPSAPHAIATCGHLREIDASELTAVWGLPSMSLRNTTIFTASPVADRRGGFGHQRHPGLALAFLFPLASDVPRNFQT